MVRRAASLGFESWWRRAESVGFCAHPIQLTGTDDVRPRIGWCGPGATTAAPGVPVLLRPVRPRHLAARARRTCRRTPRHPRHRRRASASVRHPDRTQLRACPHHRDGQSGRRRGVSRPPERRRIQSAVRMGNRCGAAPPTATSMIHVGQPLCADCYDYTGHVLFTWHLPELWRRFTITLRRHLCAEATRHGADPDAVRVSFIKVVELQARARPAYSCPDPPRPRPTATVQTARTGCHRSVPPTWRPSSSVPPSSNPDRRPYNR